jgi:hypothetical protein
MTRYILSFVLSLTVLLLGCTHRASALAVPDAKQVTRITVTRSSNDERTITQSDRIAAFIRFVAAHNDGWHTAESTFPTPRITVNAFNHDRLLLTVFLGPGWIGGRNGDQFAPDNRLHDLSAADAHEFEILLGP